MQSKLQAVNEILQKVGKLPVKTLDTGGTSTHAHVERMLDNANDLVQSQGWAWNQKADVSVTSNASDLLQVNNLELTKAKTISGATRANPCVISITKHGYKTGEEVYIDTVSGMTELNRRTFRITVVNEDSLELDGEDATTHTAYSSGGGANISQHVYHVDTFGGDRDKAYSRRGSYMFDEKDNTFTITGSTKLEYVYQLDWQDIPTAFQKWVIAQAAFDFNRSYIGDGGADQRLTQDILDTRRQATREEIRAVDINVLDQQPMKQIRGRTRMQDRSVY